MAAVTVAGLSACGPDNGAQAPTESASTSSATTAAIPEPSLELSIPDKATEISPESVVTVSVKQGTLDSVTVAAEGGKRVVEGARAGQVWTSATPLFPKTAYTITAAVRDQAGKPQTLTSTFTTVTPAPEIHYTVTPDGWTVGSGMPVQVHFDTPITSQSAKAAIESRLTLISTPAQVGSWGWVNDTTLLYRPKEYWAAGTKINVKAALAGMEPWRGAFFMEDNGADLTIGTQRVLTADLAKDTMTLTENGSLVKTFLISGGRPGERFETRSGTKVIQDKYPDIIMDSSTFGIDKADPEYYKSKVQWAMRITDSGEFLHSAPWSVAQQGHTNVSHGCINMAPADAEWLFNRVQPGDIVQSINSSIPLKPDEAGIAVWLWTWPQWQAKSAVPASSVPATPPAPVPAPSAKLPATPVPTAATAPAGGGAATGGSAATDAASAAGSQAAIGDQAGATRRLAVAQEAQANGATQSSSHRATPAGR